jgi:hypothetical protein
MEVVEKERDCSICLENLSRTNRNIVTLACSKEHGFHVACIHPWLNSNSCPLCRASLKSLGTKGTRLADYTLSKSTVASYNNNNAETIPLLSLKTIDNDLCGSCKKPLWKNNPGDDIITVSCTSAHSLHMQCFYNHTKKFGPLCPTCNQSLQANNNSQDSLLNYTLKKKVKKHYLAKRIWAMKELFSCCWPIHR